MPDPAIPRKSDGTIDPIAAAKYVIDGHFKVGDIQTIVKYVIDGHFKVGDIQTIVNYANGKFPEGWEGDGRDPFSGIMRATANIVLLEHNINPLTGQHYPERTIEEILG